MFNRLRSTRRLSAIFAVLAVSVVTGATAGASEVNVAVVDVTVPNNAVTLTAGNSAPIQINMSVSGNQVGIATFEVNRTWTLNGGVWTGSDPQEFTVAPRASSDPATTFSTAGTVVVNSGQASGTFTLAVSAFDITNSNTTGAKLQAGNPSNYNVSVNAAPAAPSDTTKPTIQFDQTPDGNSGWFRTAPASVKATATDASGISTLSCTLDGNAVAFDAGSTGGSATTKYGTVSTSSEGAHTVACEAKDASSAQNVGQNSTALKLDSGDPGVSPASVVSTAWRNTPLAQSFTASDGVSGLLLGQGLDSDGGFTLTASDESTLDGNGNVVPTVVSKTIYDVAGNSTSRSVSAWIDKTNPLLGVVDSNAASVDICTGAQPAKPTFNPSDGLSGLNASGTSESWQSAISPSGVGSYTYSAQATDNAGNSVSYGPKTYKVVYGGAFGGVLQPINADGTSRFKLGSTVPVKFQLMCGTMPVSNAVAKLTVKQGDTAPDPGVDEAVSTAASTTGNLFRYDSTSQQYIFNLSTKSGYTNPGSSTATAFSAGTWTLGINLDDGTSRTVKVQLVK